MGPLELYRARVASGALAADPAQEKMVAALQRLHDDLVRAPEPARGWRRGVAKLLGQRAHPKRGLYLWAASGAARR